MGDLMPWLAVIGLGMLHGLSPISGWTLAAARGLQAGSAAQAWRTLLPLALGQLASVAVPRWRPARCRGMPARRHWRSAAPGFRWARDTRRPPRWRPTAA